MDRENRYLTWQDTSSFSPLLFYPWLGNARELQNLIRRLVITYPHHEVTKDGLEQFLKTLLIKRKKEILIPVLESYKEMERELWKKLYDQFNGTKKEFCQKFEISETTLWRKISNMQ